VNDALGMSPDPRPLVLVCGQPYRGDDRIAFDVVAALAEHARNAATVVEAGALAIEHLLELPANARCIVVDAVAGIAPGAVIELDLVELATAEAAERADSIGRSTHALSIPQTLSLAHALRGRPIDGTFLGVGIAQCVPGSALSPEVAASVSAGARSLATLIARYATAAEASC
jgi:hydrogenase maturation protease